MRPPSRREPSASHARPSSSVSRSLCLSLLQGLSKRALLSGLLPLLRTHGSLLATVAPHLRTNTNDATHRPTPTATNA